MHDLNTFSSVEFGKFLLESKLVGDGKEKFMIHWVRRFFDFRVQHRNLSWQEQLPLFLKELNEHAAIRIGKFARRIRPFASISAIS